MRTDSLRETMGLGNPLYLMFLLVLLATAWYTVG
jgi:hypothetical protein